MTKAVLWLAVLMTFGCSEDRKIYDQCLRVDLFINCLENLPLSPASTKYNDWNEVIVACDYISKSQSRRKYSQISKECGGSKE